MRLDKYISSVTDLTRSQVRKLAKSDRISVNGEACRNVAQKVSPEDAIELDNETLGQPGPRYFKLNKPEGYICATRDGDHPTVLELLDEPRLGELQIAGRLDIDTTGLVLITDDGKWNHAVTSPKRDCKKTYYVTTVDDIAADASDKFEEGLWLDGEKKITQPAQLEIIYSNECRLTISEGRYHQIKRMFAAIGNRVESLHRESIGTIELESELNEGEYRPLSECEINSISQAQD